MFSDWKYLSQEQVNELDNEYNENNLRVLLEKNLPFPSKEEKKRKYALDFHFYNFSFCKQEGYDARKISTFMSIMNDIFIADMLNYEPSNTMTSSFNQLKVEILRHSVERPPKSILVFDRADVPKIFTFVTDSYYRRFRLYKYLYCPKVIRSYRQVNPQEVELPLLFPALHEGIQIQSDVASS